MKCRIGTPQGAVVPTFVAYDEDDLDAMLERYARTIWQTTWAQLAKRGYRVVRYPKRVKVA